VTIVVGVVVVAVVLAIAGALVVREAARMRDRPPAAIFDPDDAYDWVYEHLPELPASTLSTADVHRILDAQMDFIREHGVSENGERGRVRGVVLFDTSEAIDAIVARCAEDGETYLPEQVAAVLDCQIDYLRFIGAIDPAPAPDDDAPPSAPPE
jgi:hypothetical protein